MQKNKMNFEKAFDFFEHSTLVYLLINLVVGVSFFLLNSVTPLYGDDIMLHSYIKGTEEPIKSIADAWTSSITFYTTWHGRVIPVFINSSMTLIDKTFFDVANSVFYLLLVNLIHQYAFGPKKSNSFLCMICLGFWFCLQSFGSIIVWKSASIEYMWSVVMVLLFLLPYDKQLKYYKYDKKPYSESKRVLFAVVYFVIGIFACSFQEVVSTATCFFILTTLVIKFAYVRKACKPLKEHIAAWEITGFLGAVIGCALVTFSPGVFQRLATVQERVPDQPNLALELLFRIARVTYYVGTSMLPLFALYFVFLWVCRSSEKNSDVALKDFISKQNRSICYLLTALASAYVFVFSKGYSNRYMAFMAAMLLIAIGVVYAQSRLSLVGKGIVTTVLFFTILLASLQYATGMYLLYQNDDNYLDIRIIYAASDNEPPIPLFPDGD